MRLKSKLILLLFVSAGLTAQNKVKVDYNFKFKTGVFLDFNQVKNNNPVPKSNILTSLDKKNPDFFENLFKEKFVKLIDSTGQQVEYSTSKLWGYSEGGKLYIQWNNTLSLIPVVGTISHFISTVEVYDYPTYMDYSYTYSYSYQPVKRLETRQYILYFPTGQVFEFTPSNIEPLFATDPEILEEWTKLSRRKKKKLIFVYLRKFNERNPLYLPKN